MVIHAKLRWKSSISHERLPLSEMRIMLVIAWAICGWKKMLLS